MRRIINLMRAWMVTAILVGLAALLTVPWATWVMLAAYERDTNEKAALIAQRVRIQLRSPWYLISPETILDPLKAEIMGDPAVQAVGFIDETRNRRAFFRRDDSIPVPATVEQVDQFLKADRNSYRVALRGRESSGRRIVIYVDLSQGELSKHFWVSYKPLLKKVIAMTIAGMVVISSVSLFIYHMWGRVDRQRQQAELKQQGLLAERGLTAAVLAHEIRNPLAALRFQLHSLRRNATDLDRVSNTADTIDTELLRIQQLVQDFLVHERAHRLRADPVELWEAVNGLHTLMAELLRESGTRLHVLGESRVVVACDAHALRQVLMNLVINAQQAMGHGGTITVTIRRDMDFGCIAVADTGPGISPEIRDRLFKPFVTSKKGGSGIGLALVKRFVDNYGGSVSVESEPGKGATFFLKLPLIGTAQALAVVQRTPLAQGAVT